jgi:CAP12/Pycsar effector protein, TIR domain
MQPTVFVGSSSEGLDYARAVRALLEDDASVKVWKDLRPGFGITTIIEGLVRQVERSDFAVLILTPDDVLTTREVETPSPRDNVIFELGLSIGALGRSRTILLQGAPDLKLPSDLGGVITLPFRRPDDEDYRATMGTACDHIRELIGELGPTVRKVSRDIDLLTSRQQDQDEELSRQRTQVESLQVAIRNIVTGYELDKLNGLSQEQFPVRFSGGLKSELSHLRALGLVNNNDNTGLRTIERRYGNGAEQFDLCEHFHITDAGRQYLRVRRELEAFAAEP